MTLKRAFEIVLQLTEGMCCEDNAEAHDMLADFAAKLPLEVRCDGKVYEPTGEFRPVKVGEFYSAGDCVVLSSITSLAYHLILREITPAAPDMSATLKCLTDAREKLDGLIASLK
jgi:hypothetical protein